MDLIDPQMPASILSAVRNTSAGSSAQPPIAWLVGTLPFTGLLLAIALFPVLKFTRHWWEHNRNRFIVSISFAGLTVLYYIATGATSEIPHVLEHALLDEYLPFIVLLFSLYVICGGISPAGDLRAHPMTNTTFLAIGTLLASFVGTTGASMLLIRPLLQTNSERKHVTHTIVFFIFLVSNIGGCLLPIGDPPLFLGYLAGVPFLWTLGLWKPWLVCSLVLLIVYFIWDSIAYRREKPESLQRDETMIRPLRVRGLINLIWLALVVMAVWQVVPGKPLLGTGFMAFPFLRETIMMTLVGLSLATTPQSARERNRFNYAAIIEVAALFIGIFITMQVPLAVLKVRGAELGLNEPWQYFWATGGLSSFLDNAPTYLVFFQTANAMTHAPGPGILTLVTGEFMREDLLVGISLGAVFMGANTYIGNGPNFMVKSIAEQSGVAMPSFFGYVFRYSLPVLVPLFIIMTLLL